MAWMDKYCTQITKETLTSRSRREAETATSDEMAVIGKELQELGYTKDTNPSVFSVFAEFGAEARYHRPRKGLFLKGNCGIGKTYGMECIAKMTNAKFFCAKSFQDAYKDGFDGNDFKALCEGQNFFGEKHNMIIDELGGEEFPFVHYGQKLNLLADVLEIRYQCFLRDGLWTCVTTNLSDEELLARYGERINDRLNEMCNVKYLNGRSMR